MTVTNTALKTTVLLFAVFMVAGFVAYRTGVVSLLSGSKSSATFAPMQESVSSNSSPPTTDDKSKPPVMMGGSKSMALPITVVPESPKSPGP